MSENLVPQDSVHDISIKNTEEQQVKKNGIRSIFQSILPKITQFFMLFHQPISFFKEMKPRKTVVLELFSAISNLLIPLISIFLGSLTVVWRVYSFEKKDYVFTGAWGINLLYILIALIIMGAPSLIYCLKENFKNMELTRFQAFLFTIRQWFIQFLPFLIGFALTFLAFIIRETWHIERITVYYMVVLHLFLIWQCIVFGCLVYAQSEKKKFSIRFGVIIFISVIIGEQILAIALNDVLWEHWTITTMWREWIHWGVFE